MKKNPVYLEVLKTISDGESVFAARNSKTKKGYIYTNILDLYRHSILASKIPVKYSCRCLETLVKKCSDLTMLETQFLSSHNLVEDEKSVHEQMERDERIDILLS